MERQLALVLLLESVTERQKVLVLSKVSALELV
jgi:hypothetical protein